ncbi:MAG: tyrosine--tRNA ligase [Candidatus Krumholzibacteria bacterium]|nr:tyrosine--tRNA ligase [Candidatus Krumholzibacteria bacterium]MDH4335960.1 tyrosine--tRNA ligase [Candidatus Krumholzibacteria bacterium]MDH5627902.1 tyrosine--tRNA ligase [Candidatus Krumholzibacteria bacterium]
MTRKQDETALSVDQQMAIIRQGAVEVIPEEDLRRKLERFLAGGEPLVIKQGFDPTAPDIHLGHTVGLRKLRQFQDLGHTVVFLIGDFTGMIGDPSGRSETRRRLDHAELIDNAKTYTEQAFKILDPKKTRVDYNSRWLAKMEFADVLRLTATQTVAQMLERDDFEKRYHAGKPISLLEFVYPLAQGYDSVALQADVEIGATEQKFNLLMAREIQRQYGQEPEVILTLPILEGIDGVEKMSKSLGNYIGITEAPEEIFGKTMKIPDTLIVKYFELVTSRTPAEVDAIRARLKDPSTNPSHLKRELARTLVAEYHDAEAAEAAEAHFNRLFVQHERPEETQRVEMKVDEGGLWIAKALQQAGLCTSTSQARRMISQGAVKVDGEKVSDADLRLVPRKEAYAVQVGKRGFADIVVS